MQLKANFDFSEEIELNLVILAYPEEKSPPATMESVRDQLQTHFEESLANIFNISKTRKVPMTIPLRPPDLATKLDQPLLVG